MPRHYKISECMYCKLCQTIPWCTTCCARQYHYVLHAVPDTTVMYYMMCQTIPWCTAIWLESISLQVMLRWSSNACNRKYFDCVQEMQRVREFSQWRHEYVMYTLSRYDHLAVLEGDRHPFLELLFQLKNIFVPRRVNWEIWLVEPMMECSSQNLFFLDSYKWS